jgi:hypothetical protein
MSSTWKGGREEMRLCMAMREASENGIVKVTLTFFYATFLPVHSHTNCSTPNPFIECSMLLGHTRDAPMLALVCGKKYCIEEQTHCETTRAGDDRSC